MKYLRKLTKNDFVESLSVIKPMIIGTLIMLAIIDILSLIAHIYNGTTHHQAMTSIQIHCIMAGTILIVYVSWLFQSSEARQEEILLWSK